MGLNATDSYEDRARHLRALYRDRHPQPRKLPSGFRAFDPAEQAEHTRIVAAEYARLFPEGAPRLDQITASVWIEGRQLAGQRYSRSLQAWLTAEGTRAD